ncbi:MAG: alpha/beta fold hydrolase [Alphaproteobacteria bacterium]|nr:alpha/beta fold hydrolase [Alphaproteobacteria bacterium]
MATWLSITQYYTFHRDPNINYQLNRFLVPGAEPLFAEIGARIKNFQDWKVEFLSAAALAEERNELTLAASLYRAAEFFMSPSDPERMRAFETFITLFYRAHQDRRLERISVPYESGHLYGLKLAPASPSRGTIVVHAGYDAHMEEFYGLAQAMASRGYQVVMFDGPGQGSTLMRDNMPMTPDWEKPVGAVLDHLGLSDVTLIGISLGGCLALRAAAFEPRVERVVAFDVMLDFFQCITSRRGWAAQLALTTLVRLRLAPLINALSRAMMKYDLMSRWGIEQGMHVLGAAAPAAYFYRLKAYNTRAISKLITQDTLIMAGAEDHFVPLAQLFEQLPLLTNARSVTAQIFTRADQAQSHCQIGNLGLAVSQILSWVDAHPTGHQSS